MKRHILILIFLFWSFGSSSQVEFCPPGAQWNYFVTVLAGGHPDYYGTTYNENARYIKDTLIGTDTLKLLNYSYIFDYCGRVGSGDIFLKQKGDTIFFKGVVTQHQWQILFNFNVKPGDGWTSKVESGMMGELTFTIMVDSTKSVIENGQTLKKLFATYRVPFDRILFLDTVQYTATITELLGGSKTLFNFDDISGGWCDGDMFGGMLCYQDDDFGLKQYGTRACNYSDNVGLGENLMENKISVYPQPAAQSLHVDMSADGLYTLRLFDLHARLLARLQVQGKSATIETASLPRGMYYLQIEKDRKTLAAKKIIIE